MRRITTISRLIALFLVASFTLSAQKAVSPKAGVDHKRLSAIPIRLRFSVENGAMAGAVALVARRGQIVMLQAIGYEDIDSRKPMKTDTIFDIRSVTKPITAIGIMILMEEGKLTLNDPIEKYLSDFKSAADDKRTPITIRHMLTHTGALPLYRLPESDQIPIKRNRTLADYVSFLSKQKPEYEPGTKFRYSSGGFAILGRVIEVVSGQTFEEFMRERLFLPLGMKDSFFFIPPEKRTRIAPVYRVQNGKLERWEELEVAARVAKYPGPEFGMYSTASHLAALCQMMLNGGTFKGRRILSKMSIEAMTANQTLNIRSAITERPAYQGLGWGLSGDPMNDFPLTSPGSFGHNGAFGAIVWIDPEKALIRIFLQHRFGPGNESNVFMAMAGAAVTD